MNGTDDALRQLKRLGFAKTVYAFTMPETEAVLNQVLDGKQGAGAKGPFNEARNAVLDMHREAWSQKQDSAHKEFFQTWLDWSKPVADVDGEVFSNQYPTGGASEGIREAIYDLGHRARKERFTPVIHIFEGEYEGYKAYAEAAGIKVMEHSRCNWQESLRKIGPNDQIYLSQPSAIDGNIWDEYDDFMEALNKATPKAQVMLDLTYVGSVPDEFTVNTKHNNIDTIFFSLSKPFGVYYHRIGGFLSKREFKGLYGNMWFKNLLSLKLGTELMRRFDVFELARKYRPLQERAVAEANALLGGGFEPADVSLLATRPMDGGGQMSDLERLCQRGSREEKVTRICLTPKMAGYAGMLSEQKRSALQKGPI